MAARINHVIPGSYASNAAADVAIVAWGWTKEVGWAYLNSGDGTMRVWDGVCWNRLTTVEQDFIAMTTHVEGAAPSETMIGGCMFDGSSMTGLTLTFWATLSWVVAGACTERVRLYDYGASPGPPAVPPVAVIDLDNVIAGAGSDGPLYVSGTVLVDATGPAAGKIANSARLYVAVVTFVGGALADIASVWGGGFVLR